MDVVWINNKNVNKLKETGYYDAFIANLLKQKDRITDVYRFDIQVINGKNVIDLSWHDWNALINILRWDDTTEGRRFWREISYLYRN